MSRIVVAGIGAIAPAGWGVGALRQALSQERPLPVTEIARPGRPAPLRVRAVPPPGEKPACTRHPRLRRSSSIAQYAVGAAVEALGADAAGVAGGSIRLGVIFCAMSGCVNYSRRFYDEALRDPATASPLLFPETVFNAPASHLAALLGATGLNYTLVGDPATFLQALGVASDWLLAGSVDGCVGVGAEEMDWLVTEAFVLFHSGGIVSEGSGAVYLKRGDLEAPAGGRIELRAVTEPQLFGNGHSRLWAARQVRRELNGERGAELLCDGLQGIDRLDRDEAEAWRDWKGERLSLKRLLGEGFMAAAAWQCVAAISALGGGNRFAAATVSVIGCNQQAIGAQFLKT